MTQSIGRPDPDCHARSDAAATRRTGNEALAAGRGAGTTRPNGEEIRYGDYSLSFHKSLPHDSRGRVHTASYTAMVAALVRHDEGAIETLPTGRNRSHAGTATDPQRWTTGGPTSPRFRKLTSPLTGHVFDTEGADAGAFGISPAPLVGSDELAAEMAELYAMALLRDHTFTDIAGEADADVVAVRTALGTMPWFDGSASEPGAAGRRAATRAVVGSGADLFRGSTAGAQAGPWPSQYLLIGSTSPVGTGNTAEPSFQGVKARFSLEDGFVLYGTQVIDQRSVVAKEGIDHMTSWAGWLDCQNGVDFNGLDVFRNRRRYLTTPRDIATYVHYDALYQAYLNACLIMLADSARFPKSSGLPETDSRTRAAFASFGGPHVLSLVTEVATRGLKGVWRQKWLHHRRARPEVVAALLTLHANEPASVPADLAAELDALAAKIPADLLQRVSAHNTAQNGSAAVQPDPAHAADLPTIDAGKNYLLPMAFPEGSPTHPAYGAGHATVAGACVTVLKAMFETVDAHGRETPWPYADVFVPTLKDDEGGELVPDPAAPGLTVTGELDKLAANISIARNMAGVHYYTDYYESVRLGERVTASILEEQMGMYDEPVEVRFRSFDGDLVRITGDGSVARVRVTGPDGDPVAAEDWFGRYSA